MPKEPKRCTPETPRCKRAKILTRPTPECCRDHIRTLVFEFADLAEEHEITWWMDYGTLLGAVRNPRLKLPPGLIPHDKDADLGFLASDWPKVEKLRKIVRDRGRSWGRTPIRENRPFQSGDRVKVRISRMNKTNVDLFPWYRAEDGSYYRINYCSVDRFKGREFPEEKLLPLTTLEWEGRELPAPADPKWFCEHRYGPRWKTPIYRNNEGKRIPDGFEVEAGAR